MKIRITTTDGMLGTASANPELYEEFIGGKCADKDKVKEELESLETEDLVEKNMTVFHRNEAGQPLLYDYQIRGFIKEMIGIFVEFEPVVIGGCKVKGGVKLSKWTFKRFVDNYIFVTPREIPIQIPEGTDITTCTRPLRASTQRGDRIALAHSEEVAAGATFEFDVKWIQPKLEELVRRALDYGAMKGIGQWRNSGKGRFVWEEI